MQPVRMDAVRRASERRRLARLAVAFGGGERVVSSVVSALRVSVLTWCLGARSYGIYVALLGVVSVAGLLDFGLHYAVVNAVSHANGREERSSIREILATAFAVYSLVTVAALLVMVPVVVFLPLGTLLQLRTSEVTVARWVAAMGFGGLLCAMPLKIVPAGLIGLQKQHPLSVYRSSAQVVGLVALACTAFLWPGHLVPIVAVGSSVDLMAALAFAVWTMRRYPELALDLRAAKRQRVRVLLGSGITFVVTNLANVFKRSLGATVVAHAAGPELAPTFSVPLTMFTLGFGFVELATGSLWPAYGEAFARGDWDWIRRAFEGGTRIVLAAGLLVAVLGALYADQVMAFWTPRIAAPPQPLLLWLSLWMSAQIFASIGATLLNGLDRNRVVMWTTLLEGGVSFAGGVVAARRFGATGVAAAMAIAAIPTAFFLFGPGLRLATAGRLRPKFPAAVAGSAALAALVGAALDHVLAGTTLLVHLVVGAAGTIVAWFAATWWIALDDVDRARLRYVVTAR